MVTEVIGWDLAAAAGPAAVAAAGPAAAHLRQCRHAAPGRPAAAGLGLSALQLRAQQQQYQNLVDGEPGYQG
jgi:hypothetical protein